MKDLFARHQPIYGTWDEPGTWDRTDHSVETVICDLCGKETEDWILHKHRFNTIEIEEKVCEDCQYLITNEGE